MIATASAIRSKTYKSEKTMLEFTQKIVDGHNIESLPKWAQCHIYALEMAADIAINQRNKVEDINAIMSNPKRNWFTINNPVELIEQQNCQLWVIKSDDPRPVCSLGKGDVLFIGRVTK